MSKKKQPESGLRGPQLELAGALSLAFANTVRAQLDNRQQPVESYVDLVKWGEQTRILATAEAARLRRAAAKRGEEADAFFARAVQLRTSLIRIFGALAAGREPPPKDLSRLNSAVPDAFRAARIVRGEDGFHWGWAGEEDALERMLWPVVHSAAELLLSDGRGHVRQCPGKDCRLFFLNPTRRQRTWCDMATCGNRAKSLRYYYRHGKQRRDGRLDYIAGERPRRRTKK